MISMSVSRTNVVFSGNKKIERRPGKKFGLDLTSLGVTDLNLCINTPEMFLDCCEIFHFYGWFYGPHY